MMAHVSPANEAKLRRLIADFQLEKLEALILRQATECVLLSVSSPDGYQEKGNTRIGGVPNLPSSVKWPRRADGKLLNFIMQVDLGRLPILASHPLSRDGRLYVFVGDFENSMNLDHTVLYDNSPSQTLSLADNPEAKQMANEFFCGLNAQTMSAELALSIPDELMMPREGKHYEIEENDPIWDKYSEMWLSLHGHEHGEPPCQLLGHAPVYESDPALIAHYAAVGQKADNYSWYTTHSEEVIQGAKEWRLLVHIESNKDVGLWWGDAGAAQFMIRDADLLTGRFERTHMSMFSP